MITKRFGILIMTAIAPAFAQVASAPRPAHVSAITAPRYHSVMQSRFERGDGTVTSGNWSGYAVTGSGFNLAKGSWIVPTVTCNSATQYAVFWVGIDGYASNTVEQTGTETVCSGGTPHYSAWYEFCCTEPIITIPSMTVLPGDKMSATVAYNTSTGKFTVQIIDERTGQKFAKSAAVAGAQRTSAEWIAEAPSAGIILPLADFGTVLFGKDTTGIAATNYARNSSKAGPIGVFPVIEQITMEKSGVMESIPSGLSSDGTSFSATWAAQ